MADVRMSDIARRLGVSTVTVSKALSCKDGVGAELRNQICETAIAMGYQKKTRMRHPVDETYTVGIVVAERLRKPEHSFYWALCMNLIDMLKEYNYYNMLDVVKEEQEARLLLPDFISGKRVTGIIVLGAMRTEYLHALESTGLPISLVDYYNDDVNAASVIPDNFYGGCAVTTHLLKNGHRRIGFVGGIDVNNNAQDRYYGYCKALRAYDLSPRPDWIICNRDKVGVLKETFELPQIMPTAFFCDNDQSAYYFIHQLRKSGYRIPQDISVMGFYDHVYATLLEPQLTTFRIDIRRMANEAVHALLRQLHSNDNIPERIIITGRVIERGSVADLRA